MLEINSETDFVSKGDDFNHFCNNVVAKVLETQPTDLEALLATDYSDGKTVEEARKDLIVKIGENISVRRFALLESEQLGVYLHGVRIGVLVNMQGGNEELAKDVAMHIAASRPQFTNVDEVPGDIVAKEKDILIAQAQDSGKPPEIIEKIVGGRIKKYLGEITLLGQPFVKNPDQTVEELLKANSATVSGFVRFEVGEGIEKKSENFADEVMKQVQGN